MAKMICAEDCEYRNRFAPFCGYCLIKILREVKEENVIKETTYNFGKTGTLWSRHRKEDLIPEC